MVRQAALLFAAVLASAVPAAGQVEMSRDLLGPATIHLELLCFAGPDSAHSRLDAFVQVEYENLSFVKTTDLYRASYDVVLTVTDQSNSTVTEQSWTEQVTEKSFDATNASGASRVSQRSIPLAPGEYTVAAQIHDNESRVTRRLEHALVVPPFLRGTRGLSGIMLLNRLTVQGGKRTIVPNLTGNISGGAPVPVFLEAYSIAPAESLGFHLAVLNEKDEVRFRADTTLWCTPGRNEVFLFLDVTTLPVGDYRLQVTETPKGQAAILAASGRAIGIRWRGLPANLANLDLAIAQFRYIAHDSEMDSLKAAKTLEEKQRLFLEFWKRRDPNPNTPRNERMEEYYARVEYANKHFSRYRDGWKTDMGMVYVMFGPPSNVERHPFEGDSKPYEVWSYYDLNESLVFVDDNGFGDYRLVTPLWDIQRKLE